MWQVLYSMATIVEDREAGMRIKMKAWFGAGKICFTRKSWIVKAITCKGMANVSSMCPYLMPGAFLISQTARVRPFSANSQNLFFCEKC